MSLLEGIKAVSFDVDGTLYDSSSVFWRIGVRHPLSIRGILAQVKVQEALRGEQQVWEDLAVELDQRTAQSLGASVEAVSQRRRWLHDEIIPAIIARLKPLRGLRRVLDKLVEEGVKIGVLSDHSCDAKLAAMGLEGLPWRVRVASLDAGAFKPHGRPFELLLEGLEMPANEVLHVGDRRETDIAGAIQSGLRAAHRRERKHPAGRGSVPQGELPQGAEPELSFSHYDELFAYLFR